MTRVDGDQEPARNVSTRPAAQSEYADYGSILLIWMILIVAINGVRWIGGIPSGMLVEGVEQGVARAEVKAGGESTEEQVRKAIRTQRQTLSFWTALAALSDFLCEPVILAGRAVLVATLFTGVAALSGKGTQYGRALRECALAQGFWVLGMATRLALMIGLHRPDTEIETSLALFLPPGPQAAALWVLLRQLDLFTLIGWIALTRQGWRRGEAGLPTSALICGGVGLFEIGLRAAAGLLMGAAIRLCLELK
jgi:hypothetical protein